MNKESKAFLYKLLQTSSPSGFEEKIQRVVRSRMKQYADSIEVDLHGNLICGINTRAPKKVMLAGHCDQIGFMVRRIDKDGFIYLDKIGGVDLTTLYGEEITIQGSQGEVVGVVGRTPIHKQPSEERSRPKLEMHKIWVDIGAKDKKDAEKRVAIGDPATFTLRVRELSSDLICAPGLDDKAGLFIAMETLRLCARSKLNVALYAVSTVQEELGLRGARTSAHGIEPEVGIGIDVTHASDNPGGDESKDRVCHLGKGPGIYTGPNINPVVYRRMVASAKKAKVPHQILPSAGLLGNDSNALQVAASGVAAGCVGLPNRYMHTQVEVCSLKDIENSAKLLAAFIKDIGARTDFRPR